MHLPAILPPNPLEELEQNKKTAELKQLTKKERRRLKKQRQIEEQKRELRKHKMKKATKIAVITILVGAGIFALVWFLSSIPKLPPTSMEGHVEQSPPSHILNQPMEEVIQKHMLEHADGRGRPGIIIQYNCDQFECEPGLIRDLVDLVKQYPNHVYLAPNSYNGKIILTKLYKKKVLAEFDEEIIRSFIEE